MDLDLPVGAGGRATERAVLVADPDAGSDDVGRMASTLEVAEVASEEHPGGGPERDNRGSGDGPHPDPKVPEDPVCAVCGGRIDADDVVCPHCGASLVAG